MKVALFFLFAFSLCADLSDAFVLQAPPPPPPSPVRSVEYDLIADIDFSPYAGGQDLLFATRALERVEDWLSRSPPSKTIQARFFRLTNLITVWLPLNYMTEVVQHEVFGHGYRVRSLGSHLAEVSSYQIGVPPPYGPGGGATYYGLAEQVTTMELSAVASAGVEATAILANLTKYKWLPSRTLDPRQALLYIFCQQNLTRYVATLKDMGPGESDGHDISGWLFWLNTTYPKSHLSRSQLRTYSLINLADPFSFYALWACLHYIGSGRETKIPMIPFFGAGYLFAPRLGLAPYGPEFFWENYFSAGDRFYYGYLKGGSHAGNSYFGMGALIPQIWHKGQFAIGLRSDFWIQPKLLLEPGSVSPFDLDALTKPLYPSSELHDLRAGLSLSAIWQWRWSEVWGCSLEAGGKTQGFLPGYSLFAASTLRGGLSAKF